MMRCALLINTPFPKLLLGAWLGLGLCGAAMAQTPAVDVQVLPTFSSAPGIPGPAGRGFFPFKCVNLGTAVATGVSCTATFEMRRSDGTTVVRTPDLFLRCSYQGQQGTGPFTLQPNGDTVYCSASFDLGGTMGGDDYPFVDYRGIGTTSAENESAGADGNNTFVNGRVPIYDALSDAYTHPAGVMRSYNLFANDQFGVNTSPSGFDRYVSGSQGEATLCLYHMASGYKNRLISGVTPALIAHSDVFTLPSSFDATNVQSILTLPLNVVFTPDGQLTVPATLPPGEYDLFYAYGSTGSPRALDGYPNPDGNLFASAPCDPAMDYAAIKLIVVAPQVSVSKTASTNTLTAGGTITYTVVVSNAGTVSADGTAVSDPVPAGITAMSWTCAGTGGATCGAASGSGALSDTIGALPVGGSATYTVTAQISATPPPSITNTATITPPTAGVCSGSGCSSASVAWLATPVPTLEWGALCALAALLGAAGMRRRQRRGH